MAPVPEPSLDLNAARADFSNRTNELANAVNEAANKWNELKKKVDDLIDDMWFFDRWDWLGGDQDNKLRSSLSDGGGKLQQLIDDIGKVIAGSKPVLDLYDAAIMWTNSVQAPVSSRAGFINTPRALSLRQWKGEASEVYYITVMPMHGKAVEATGTMAAETSKWLADVATKNLNFMLELVEPIVKLTKEIIAALLSAASIAGLLEAIGKLAQFIADTIGLVWDIAKATAKKIGETLQVAISARTIANNQGAFPGGHWPDFVKK